MRLRTYMVSRIDVSPYLCVPDRKTRRSVPVPMCPRTYVYPYRCLPVLMCTCPRLRLGLSTGTHGTGTHRHGDTCRYVPRWAWNIRARYQTGSEYNRRIKTFLLFCSAKACRKSVREFRTKSTKAFFKTKFLFWNLLFWSALAVRQKTSWEDYRSFNFSMIACPLT